MAQRTQLRLSQITASFGTTKDPNAGNISDSLPFTTTGSIVSNDLGTVLGNIASSIRRIAGGDDFTVNERGHFGGTSADDYNLHITGSLAAFSKAATIRTDAGALTINGTAGVSIQEAETDVIAIDTNRAVDIAIPDGQSLTMGKTSAAQITVTPHGTAGSEVITVINTGGTDAAAIALTSTAGGITATYAADKNLKLTNADDDLKIELVDASGAAANEKITLTNTNGTNAAAIGVLSAAGGITVSGSAGITLGGSITATGGAGTIIDLNAQSLDIDTIGAVAIDATGASNFSTDSGALTISGSGGVTLGGNVTFTGGAGVVADLNAASFDIDATAGAVTIDTAGAGNDIRLDSALGSVHIVAGENSSTGILLDAEHASATISAQINSTAVVSIAAGAVTVAQPQTISDATDSTSTGTGALIVAGGVGIAKNLFVGGNLNVVGDTTTLYVTSSTVEFQDPMIVTNANSSEATGLYTSASFVSNKLVVEGGMTDYDYGVIFKRSIGASSDAGIGNAPNMAYHSINADPTDTPPAGNPLAMFKLDSDNFHVTDAEANATTAIAAGQVVNFKMANIRDANNPVERDILDNLRGAFLLISSSNGSGKRAYGMIISGSTNATNNVVKVQLLGSSEKYDDDSSADSFDRVDLEDNKGSLQLINAYAGNIFDREDNAFHMAAAAVTGSSDNALSGTVAQGVLMYAGANAAALSIHLNDYVSGSTEYGRLSAGVSDGFKIESKVTGKNINLDSKSGKISFFSDGGSGDAQATFDVGTAKTLKVDVEGAGNPSLQVERKGISVFNAQTSANSGELTITHNGSSRGTLIKTANNLDLKTLVLPNSNGSADQFLQTDGAGNLSFASAAGANLAKAVFQVRPNQTVTAGSEYLILSASATTAESHYFDVIGTGVHALTGGISGQIDALTDEELFKKLEVYVNGQLLTSGTLVNKNAPSDGDYVIVSTTDTKISGAFAFDLEADDIVTLIAR